MVNNCINNKEEEKEKEKEKEKENIVNDNNNKDCIELDVLEIDRSFGSITDSIGSNSSGIDSSSPINSNIDNRYNNSLINISIEINNSNNIDNNISVINNNNDSNNNNNNNNRSNTDDTLSNVNHDQDDNNNNTSTINSSNENYVFGIRFNYPEIENVVIIKKEDNQFFWKWSKQYPEKLRDYIAKEDFLNDIEYFNGLKRYYLIVLSLYTFWLIFFFVMIFVGLYPKLNPIILGMFTPFFVFALVNIIYQFSSYKRNNVFKQFIENKITQTNLKYRDINIQWRLVSKQFVNFYRVKKIKTYIEIHLPPQPMELTRSYPPFSNIQVSSLEFNNQYDNNEYI